MTNTPPEPNPLNPSRALFGGKARDPASVMDALQQAEQDKWERDATTNEVYTLDGALMIAPAAFFYGLWRNTDLSHIAYIMWPLADLMWTPWLILRVDRARPPGDTARATAFLGYAQLGWPLSALAIELMPVSWEFLTAFPIVFGWSVAFAILAVRRPRARPQPGLGRAAMLAGGAFAYLFCAVLLLGAADLLWTRAMGVIGDTAPLVFSAIFTGAFLMALPGVCLLPTVWKAWRMNPPFTVDHRV